MLRESKKISFEEVIYGLKLKIRLIICLERVKLLPVPCSSSHFDPIAEEALRGSLYIDFESLLDSPVMYHGDYIHFIYAF